MKRLSAFLFGEKKDYAFRSDFNIDECNGRLQTAVVQNRPLIETILKSDPSTVIGRFDGTNFQLKMKKSAWSKQSDYVFYGTMTAQNGGTLICGHFDAEGTLKFMVLMPLFIVIIWLVFILDIQDRNLFWRVLYLVVLVLLFVVVIFVSIIRGRERQPHILDFIQTTLLATPAIPNTFSPNPSDRQGF